MALIWIKLDRICSPVTGNGDIRQIAEKLFVRFKTNKQTGKEKNCLLQTGKVEKKK
jgi:hypothetical protein